MRDNFMNGSKESSGSFINKKKQQANMSVKTSSDRDTNLVHPYLHSGEIAVTPLGKHKTEFFAKQGSI
jgi:hypothetical protein